jgi:hypothetical protein
VRLGLQPDGSRPGRIRPGQNPDIDPDKFRVPPGRAPFTHEVIWSCGSSSWFPGSRPGRDHFEINFEIPFAIYKPVATLERGQQ